MQTQVHYSPLYNSPDGSHKLIIKPEQQFHPAMGGAEACQNAKLHQQQPPLAQTLPLSPQGYPQPSQGMTRPANPSCDFHGQMEPQGQQQGPFPSGGGLSLGLAEGRRSHTPMMQVKEMMVRNYVQSQQALMWEQQQEQRGAGGVKAVLADSSMDISSQQAMMQHSPQHQNQNLYPGQVYPAYTNQNLMSPPAQGRGPGSVAQKEQQLLGLSGSCYSQEMVVPRPPQGRKPLSRQSSLTQQGGAYLGSPPHLSPVHSTTSPRRAVRLAPVQQNQPEMFSPSNNNSSLYYTGQPMGLQNPQSGPCLNQQGHMGSLEPGTKSASLAYPESGPISNALENLDLDNAQIDFTSIIDDPDPSSFSPVPPHLQQGSASQSSSRLTTPQTSLNLPNMAVADMTSMLTSLAGENKYLNTLS